MPAKNIVTTPYWATSATFPQFAGLTEDLVADIVVVGTGITGLTDARMAELVKRFGWLRFGAGWTSVVAYANPAISPLT